jgi:hypothetical protein
VINDEEEQAPTTQKRVKLDQSEISSVTNRDTTVADNKGDGEESLKSLKNNDGKNKVSTTGATEKPQQKTEISSGKP